MTRGALLGSLLLLGMVCASPARGKERAPSAKPSAPPQFALAVAGGEVSVNGKRIDLPGPQQALIEQLGEPSRILKQSNCILVWDDLGIFGYGSLCGTLLIEIDVALQDLSGSVELWPTSTFRGTLSLDGAPVTASTTPEAINRAKKGEPLVRSQRVASEWTISYDDALVGVSTAPDDRAAPGTVTHLAIGARPKQR